MGVKVEPGILSAAEADNGNALLGIISESAEDDDTTSRAKEDGLDEVDERDVVSVELQLLGGVRDGVDGDVAKFDVAMSFNELDLEQGADAEGTASSNGSVEEVGVLLARGLDETTVGEDDLDRDNGLVEVAILERGTLGSGAREAASNSDAGELRNNLGNETVLESGGDESVHRDVGLNDGDLLGFVDLDDVVQVANVENLGSLAGAGTSAVGVAMVDSELGVSGDEALDLGNQALGSNLVVLELLRVHVCDWRCVDRLLMVER